MQGGHEPEWDLHTGLHPSPERLPAETLSGSCNHLGLLGVPADQSTYVSLAEVESAGSTPKACLEYESPEPGTSTPAAVFAPQGNPLDASAFRANRLQHADGALKARAAVLGLPMAADLVELSFPRSHTAEVRARLLLLGSDDVILRSVTFARETL